RRRGGVGAVRRGRRRLDYLHSGGERRRGRGQGRRGGWRRRSRAVRVVRRRAALLSDPAGAVFGVWRPGTHRGAQLVNEPGAWAMSILNTPDVEGPKR